MHLNESGKRREQDARAAAFCPVYPHAIPQCCILDPRLEFDPTPATIGMKTAP
jgi:hypothetical protein